MAGHQTDDELEQTPLLQRRVPRTFNKSYLLDDEASSLIGSHMSKAEQQMGHTAVGERLPYNDYTTIDFLHDLVKDSHRLRFIHSRGGLRGKCSVLLDQAAGWFAAALIGVLTACVAFLVDVSEATVSDWKYGYCSRNPFLDREGCCMGKTPLGVLEQPEVDGNCPEFKVWSTTYSQSFAVYVGFALVYGIVSASVTMLTKRTLPAVETKADDNGSNVNAPQTSREGKTMYMAAGSGIPEIKTILSGFVIPHFLDFKVLFVKAVGAVFAVATGMCLGKEGPFVHISTCVGFLVSKHFPKYRENGRKMREMLSVACAAGLSVAFGAPIGGVLFSYEEISTYFPRKVLWRAFLCSLSAAAVLKALNPNGNGRLVLFETHYGTSFGALHCLVFVLLGVAGGIFGGTFCRLNKYWSRWFRSFWFIKQYPVFEAFLIVLVTALLQYQNPLTREPGDKIIGNLLVDCRDSGSTSTWVCRHELNNGGGGDWTYRALLVYGTLVKLLLTIITFGIKVPSGIIIPSLDAGAFFGRLVGQCVPGISPGIFAMVGAGAFLAGVSRMTISLCVIMFELTGELEYVIPHMIAILVAKWVADLLGQESVYDVAQSVLGHPFLDVEHCMHNVQKHDVLVEELIPPPHTMHEITVVVPPSNQVPRNLLETKLDQLRKRGLLDAGLVFVQDGGILQGYIAQGELEFGLEQLGQLYESNTPVRLFGEAAEGDFDMSHLVDRVPLSIRDKAPLEYAVEMFGKLGLRYLMVTEEGSGRLVGVIIKKRLVAYLESM